MLIVGAGIALIDCGTLAHSSVRKMMSFITFVLGLLVGAFCALMGWVPAKVLLKFDQLRDWIHAK